jgi:predicted PurR-regulated permease PerM
MESADAMSAVRARDGDQPIPPGPPPGAPPTLGEAAPVRLAAPSLRGVVRTVLMVTVCGIGLYLVWRVRTVIRLGAISLFFALKLMPIVDAATSRTRLPRALVILGVSLVLIASIALVGYVVVPSLVKEIEQLSHDAPRYALDLRHNASFRRYDDR